VLVAVQSTDPDFYEIPTTLEGWRDTRDELTSRVAARRGAPAVLLTTPYGTLAIWVARMGMAPTTAPAEDLLWVSGRLTVDGRAYKVWGPPPGELISPTDGLSHYDDAEMAQVRNAVAEALQRPDGEHVELYALTIAEKGVRWAGLATKNFADDPNGRDTRWAREAPCRLASVGLAPASRRVAFRWVDAGFVGSVADLRDAASDVADLRGGAYGVALSMIDGGYTGPPEDLAPIAEATVQHPVYHGAP